MKGIIKRFIHCPAHSAPLIEVVLENKEKILSPAPEGIAVGDSLSFNKEMALGSLLPLKDIPEGALIYNIEAQPGGGGKFVRAGGTFAKIISKTNHQVEVLLPSKKTRIFLNECRAMIGTIAGAGRKEKPFLKAGKKYFEMRKKNKLYPRVSGVSMNAVSHPFGSHGRHKGKPSTVSRHAPPGRKVGLIAARRAGRKKR